MQQDEKQIFDAAREIDDFKARHRYLDSICGKDHGLRARVEELIGAWDECGSFMRDHAAESFESTASAEGDAIGTLIGRYKLLEKIGEGGFGNVFMAEQQEPVVRRVALKIIKPGMDSKQVIARFEAERQAMAIMDHPNIGKILDAGATKQGRPFFVMELVRGIPITEYCERRRLSTEERLELFAEVCEAIEHAHQKGIIHRDIKPTNILVYNNGDRAVPKVIDFGIAKATQGRLTDKTLFTQFQQFIGTPAYMSPEQAQMSGVDVDTRSDIYSLGVLLYELLTGKPPLEMKDLKERALDEACRRILEDEAPAPSKRVSTLTQDELSSLATAQKVEPRDVASRLRGELDWIVMRALEKDRNRRYRSTDALIGDIRAHLRDEPISAGPPSFAYAITKLLKRHRGAVLTTVSFATLLLAATTISTMGWRSSFLARQDLKRSEQEARDEQQKAQEAAILADQERHRAVKSAYVADMQVWNAKRHDIGLLRRILKDNSHFDNDGDPRCWEWRALWARCRGNAERQFGKNDGSVSLRIDPSGRFVATDGFNLRIWNFHSGEIVWEREPEQRNSQFSPDGKHWWVSDPSGTVRAFTVPDFRPTEIFVKHPGKFDWRNRDFLISPNGKFMVTCGTDKHIKLWNMTDRKALTESILGGGELLFSQDNAFLEFTSKDGEVTRRQRLDLESFKVESVKESQVLKGRVYSPNGREYVRRVKNTVMIHSRSTNAYDVLGTHRGSITDVAYSPDGQLVATASNDKTVKLWNSATRQHIATLQEHESAVTSVAFLPNGQRIISGDRSGTICVWEIADVAKKTWPFQQPSAYNYSAWYYWPQFSWSHDGERIATTTFRSWDSKHPGVNLWSSADLKPLGKFARESGHPSSLIYSPVEELLVVSNKTGALEFIDTRSGKTRHIVTYAAKHKTLPIRFSSDGSRLLAVVKKGPPQDQETVCMAVYRVSDGEPINFWSIRDREEKGAAISPDGKTVVTCEVEGLRFWAVDAPENSTHVDVGHHLYTPDFSPDGKFVAAGAQLEGRIVIIDVETRQFVDDLRGHAQHVAVVRFSPDGKRLASGGSSSFDAVKIWDFESRREVFSLPIDDAWSVRHLEWSPDGNAIVVGSGVGEDMTTMSLFRVPSMSDIQDDQSSAHTTSQ